MSVASRWSRLTSTVGVVALTAGGLTLAVAPAASADSAGFTNYGNGTVGVTQNIAFAPGGDPSSCGAYTLTVSYSSPTNQTFTVPGVVSGNNVLAAWTPAIAGTVSGLTMNSSGGCSPASATNVPFTISKVNTTTVVSSPNTTTVGQPMKVEVTIQSTSPSAYQPTGQITVVNANGAPVSSAMGLAPGPGNGQSYAYFWWTPPSAGTYFFRAQYSGDANANGSAMSPTDTTIATPSGNTISLNAPPTMTQGQSVTLTATVFPAGTQGSVGFTLNGNPISASIPLNSQGQAQFTWTPNVAGQVTLGANYTTNGGGSGSTSEVVTINAGPAQFDNITLVQPGWGPWSPNGTYTLGNGSNFTFQASSLSGAPVTLSETGPCTVSGLTINVPTGSGVCNLKASTNGGNGYGPITFGYTINLIPGTQTASVSAPASGAYPAGRVLVLESPTQQDTNAGQNIQWKVKKGGKGVCKVLYPSSGAVNLRIVKRGSCTVIGSAPGVPGQWNPFQTARTYTGR
jgi:hypothetical protein